MKISRHAAIIIGLLLCLAVFGCQTYTSGLVKSGARGDEAVVLSNLRAIMVAQSSYNLSTSSFGTFEQLTDGGYLNAGFKTEKPVLSDYVYTMTVAAKNPGSSEASYSCNADPQRTGDRAGRHFYIDSASSEIHVNATQPASAADETIKP